MKILVEVKQIVLEQAVDPVVVLASMKAIVGRTVMMKIVELNHHELVEHRMVFPMKSLQFYLEELIEWNILLAV